MALIRTGASAPGFTMCVGGSSASGGYAALSKDFVEQFTTIVATRHSGSSNCQVGTTTYSANATISVSDILGQTNTDYGGGIETYLFYVPQGATGWSFQFS